MTHTWILYHDTYLDTLSWPIHGYLIMTQAWILYLLYNDPYMNFLSNFPYMDWILYPTKDVRDNCVKSSCPSIVMNKLFPPRNLKGLKCYICYAKLGKVKGFMWSWVQSQSFLKKIIYRFNRGSRCRILKLGFIKPSLMSLR